jgi:hypothetical protein
MTIWNETLAMALLGGTGNHVVEYRREQDPEQFNVDWFEPRRPLIGKRKVKPSPDRRAKVKAARKAKHRNKP